MPLLSVRRLLALLLLALPLLARADYQITIKGGSWTTNGPSGPLSGNVADSATNASGASGNAVRNGSASCKGPFTAHFKWLGTAPRPPAIIVKEEATASWSGSSGSCDPALPLTEHTPSASPLGDVKKGVRYSVKQNPPAEFDLSPTVDPSASVAYDGTGGGRGGQCGVTYAVTAVPVTISIAGTTPSRTATT